MNTENAKIMLQIKNIETAAYYMVKAYLAGELIGITRRVNRKPHKHFMPNYYINNGPFSALEEKR